MSAICKIGKFSDGGERVRIVKPGFDADPAPADPRNIIFDSDWPELLSVNPGFSGQIALPGGSGLHSVSITFPSALPYVPKGYVFSSVQNANNSGRPFGGVGWQSDAVFNTANLPDAWTPAGAYQDTDPFSNDYSQSSLSVSNSGMSWQTTYSGVGYTQAWFVVQSDDAAIYSTGFNSRQGTNYVQLTQNGLVVAKRGVNVNSGTLTDFLIPPISLGSNPLQPYTVQYVSQLPWNRNGAFGGTNYASFLLVIPHNLGYVPFVIFTPSNAYFDPASIYNNTGGLLRSIYAVDANNVYVFSAKPTSGVQGQAGDTIDIDPLGFLLFKQQFI